MSLLYVASMIIAIASTIYLFIALMFPEKFS